MSPKVAHPETRVRLLDEAARLLAERGSAALTARRLADGVGSSTMAIYTHFGDMDGLRRAVRLEGFRRLAAHLDSVQQTHDPVADQAALGWAYCVNALANPHA